MDHLLNLICYIAIFWQCIDSIHVNGYVCIAWMISFQILQPHAENFSSTSEIAMIGHICWRIGIVDSDHKYKIQKSKTKNVQVIFHKQHQKLYQSYA